MLTVRYENLGMILYSHKKKNYYYTSDIEIIDKCKKIFKNINHETDDELISELKELGLDEGVREIEFQNNNNNLNVPLEYYFDFTSKCNLKCTHCYNRDNISSTTMNNNQIKNIIKDMYNNGIMRIHLAGGEPTTVPDGLRTYMETAKKYGIISSMSSNGVEINDEIYEIVFDNDLFSITISLEGATEESNAKIRGKGNFEKSINTIKKLVLLKEKLNKDTIICIKTSYDTSTNKKDLENIIKLGLSLGVDVVKFANPERCIYHEKGYYGNEYDRYYKILKDIKELKEQYKDKIYISDVANPINNCGSIGLPGMKGCIGGQELIAINPDGRISPCLMNQLDLGNINDYDSILDFYNSDSLKAYRKLITDYNCDDCEIHSSCRGGCQVRKYVEYGEIKNIDPLCPTKKYNKELLLPNNEEQKKLKKVKILHSL